MSRINFMGSYSGIDGSQIDALMEAEKMPIVHMSNKKTGLEEKQNAWKDINTRLNSLFDKAKALSTPSTFASKKATSTNNDFVSMSVSNSAADQIYNINVEQLAGNTRMVGREVNQPISAGRLTITSRGNESPAGKIEKGKLTIAIPGEDGISKTIDIAEDEGIAIVAERINKSFAVEEGEGNKTPKISAKVVDGKLVIKNSTDENENLVVSGSSAKSLGVEEQTIDIEIKDGESLKDVVAKINNNKDSGVSASIVNNRLILEDKQTGARGLSIKGTPAEGTGGNPAKSLGLSDLSDLEDKVGGQEGWRERGKGSIVTVNGIEIESDSNTISGAIDGVTINLKKAHGAGSSDTEVVTVATDFSKAEKAIQEFVDQYNSTMNFMKEQSKAGDPEVPGSSGKLRGDSSLVALEAKLRRVVGGRERGAEIENAAQLGISTFDRHGDLTFDASKFREQIEKNPDAVVDFFSNEKTGFVVKVNSQIDGYISKENGIIKSKNEGFDRSLKRLNTDIDRFNDRMERREEYYIKMFSRLDVAMMQAESQMQWLVGQVDAMNAQR